MRSIRLRPLRLHRRMRHHGRRQRRPVRPVLPAHLDSDVADVARTTVYGFGTPSPSLKGDTGVFELGVTLTPGSRPDEPHRTSRPLTGTPASPETTVWYSTSRAMTAAW